MPEKIPPFALAQVNIVVRERYAIVEDPDGSSVGIMSAIDNAKRRAVPPPPST